MLMRHLKDERDIKAILRAQIRTFSHHPHRFKIEVPKEENKMSVANAALARAAQLRKSGKPAASKNGKTSKETKKPVAKKASTRGATDAEKNKVIALYKQGKTSAEISDAMGWTDKKNNWPYYYTLGVIRQLRAAGKIGYRREPKKGGK